MLYDNKLFTKIPNTEFYYVCESTSEVLSTQRKKPLILKQCPLKEGYLRVTLFDKNGERFDKMIHRLMAEMFVPGDISLVVNHLDGCKTNNLPSNLEWCTIQENTQHAVDIGLITNSHFMKEVHQYMLNGTFIKSFKSVAEASKELKTNIAPNVTKHIAGERPHVLGYQWSYDLVDSLPNANVSLLKQLHLINMDTGEEQHFIGRGSLKKAADILGITNSALVCRFRSTNTTFFNEFKLIKEYYE